MPYVKRTTPPAIWPDKARDQGLRAVRSGIVSYIARNGKYPTRAKLARHIRSTKYAVGWYTDENMNLGLVEKHNSEIRLTPAGWAAQARTPILPWRSHRRNKQVKEIANRVVKEFFTHDEAD